MKILIDPSDDVIVLIEPSDNLIDPTNGIINLKNDQIDPTKLFTLFNHQNIYQVQSGHLDA